MAPNRRGCSDMDRRRRKLIMTLAVFAIILNIICLTVGLFTLISRQAKQTSERSKDADGWKNPIACVKCSSISRSSHLAEKLSQRVEDGQDLCCAGNSDQMSTLMEVAMTKPPFKIENVTSDRPKEETPNFNLSKVSAHKRLLPSEEFRNPPNIVPLFTNEMVGLNMNVTHHKELMEHAIEVHVRDWGYEIIHEGHYHIYSSVRFKPDSAFPCYNFTYKIWEQSVMRSAMTSESEEKLLSSVYTCCDNCTQVKETTFAGGTFYLRQGDKLKVAVSGLGLVSYRSESSFFGLVMLNSSEKEKKMSTGF